MKRIFAIFFVLMILSALFGCTGFEISEEEQRFIGTWISKPSNHSILTLVIKDDKFAELWVNTTKSADNPNEELYYVSGYWCVDKDQFIISYGANLTTYTIRFQVREDTLETTWMNVYVLNKEP